jgi:SP family sugar:H+ symporter-like MFS transporter
MRGQDANSDRVNAEMTEILANIEFEKSLGKATYADCFRGNMLARTRACFVPFLSSNEGLR